MLVTCKQCGKKSWMCSVLCCPCHMKLATQQAKRVLALCAKDRISGRRRVEEGAIQENGHNCKVCKNIDCVFLD